VPLLENVVENGRVVCNRPSLEEIRQRVKENLSNLPDIYRELDSAPVYPVGFSKGLVELRERIIEKIRREELS